MRPLILPKVNIATTFVILSYFITGCTIRNNIGSTEKSLNDSGTTVELKKPHNDSLTTVHEHSTPEKSGFKEMSDSGVFEVIHSRLFETLTKSHKTFFTSKPDYRLLSVASGDLFQNNKEGNSFIVYDSKYEKVTILVFDGLTKKYFELYKDIKVINSLETSDCYNGYGKFGSEFESELYASRDDLIKKPESFLESERLKITDITKDDDMILKYGCLSKDFKAGLNTKSLCIMTDFVYNNWECLSYNKANNAFVIFYEQAFAD